MLILSEIGYAIDVSDEQLTAYALDEMNSPILEVPIPIHSLGNRQIVSKFGAFTMALVPKSEHICHVCGAHYRTKSGRSNTCSDLCRTQKSRIKKNISMIGADDLFLDEFRLHVKNLDSEKIGLSFDYLLENMREYKEIVKKLSPRDLKYLILSNQGSM